jgi:hypothetical protein
VILEQDWEEGLGRTWSEALGRLAAALPDGVEPSGWNGYKLARARMRGVALRLRELLTPLGEEVELICERRMTALGERLIGKPDLVILGEGVHWIVDYKTGGVLDFETRLPKAEYVTQLQQYAVLEHERSGEWPSTGFLMPFRHRTIEVELDPVACDRLAALVAAAVNEFNEWAPATQPASPMPANCQWCGHAAECEEVWEVCDESWAPQVALTEGVVVQAAHSEIGLMTIVVDVSRGTLGEGRIAIKGDPNVTALPESLEPGARMRASGLRRKGERTYSLVPWSELRVGQL